MLTDCTLLWCYRAKIRTKLPGNSWLLAVLIQSFRKAHVVVRLPTWILTPSFVAEGEEFILDAKLVSVLPTEAATWKATGAVGPVIQNTVDVVVPLITLSGLGKIIWAVH